MWRGFVCVAEVIKAVILLFLPDLLSIMVKVECARKGLVSVLLGSGGDTVSKVAKQAEQDLRNTFRTEVKLGINIVYGRKKKSSRK